MKIFLTGGTGFIGSHFINHSHSAGHKIVAVRRHDSSQSKVLLEREPMWIQKEIHDIQPDDLLDCDAVVHLAAAGVSPQIATWQEMIDANVSSSQKLFELAVGCGIRRWVVAGTFAEYGRSGERYELIPDHAPLEPTFPYAATKAAFFQIISAMAVQNSASLAYLRLFSVYGPGQHEDNLWPSLQKAALSGKDFLMTPGEQIRDFIPVKDVVAAILYSVHRTDITPGIPFVRNLGSGTPTTLIDFATRWWKEFGATGRILPGAIPYRANEVMRYIPQVDPSVIPAA
jgi:nucleoside-diphosphate-sugar epimerase